MFSKFSSLSELSVKTKNIRESLPKLEAKCNFLRPDFDEELYPSEPSEFRRVSKGANAKEINRNLFLISKTHAILNAPNVSLNPSINKRRLLAALTF